MHNLVLSILAAALIGGVAVTKVDVNKVVQLPVVKAVGFGAATGVGVGVAARISDQSSRAGTDGTVGGQEADGWVELSAPAPCVTGCGTYVNGKPAGGMMVHISSSNPALAKVQTATGLIVVPVGQTRTTFTVLTSGVSTPTRVTISAWREGSAPQTTTLNVVPPSLTGVTTDQTSLTGGSTAHGTLTFNGTPAAAGVVKATLSSSNPAAVQVPTTVSLDVSKTVATFDIKTSAVASSTPVTITATSGDRKPTAKLTVTPAVLASLDATVRLTGAAPPGGAVVTLSSADPARTSVPPTVTVPAGSTWVNFPFTDHPDFSSHDVTVSATYNGVTMKSDHPVAANFKPDLAIKVVTLQDRFGNTITHPADAQPYKMCVTIELLGMDRWGNCLMPTSTALGVSYMNSPTGTGASAGHDFDVPVTFPTTSYSAGAPGWRLTDNARSVWWYEPPTCVDMPGLPQPGAYTDVTLKIDSKNTVDETNEGNNTHKLRITRQ